MCRRLLLVVLTSLAVFGVSSCKGSFQGAGGDTGNIAAQIDWPGGAGGASAQPAGFGFGGHVVPLSAPTGIVTMRFTLSASDVVPSMVQSFAAAVNSGTLNNVPAGSARTLTIDGLNGSNAVVYTGASTTFSIAAGSTASVTVSMAPSNPATTLPWGGPATVNASAGDGQVSLNWTVVGGATSYKVYRSASVTMTSPTITSVSALVYSDTTVSNGSLYYYQVTALDAFGESTGSTVVSASPQAQAGNWSVVQHLNTARNPGVSELNGKLYSFGGQTGVVLNAVEIYTPAANAWAPGSVMPTARNIMATVALDGLIYVVGGLLSSGSATAVNEVYNPSSNSWDTSKAAMLTARYGVVAATVNGVIYAIGGNGGIGTEVEAYDPVSNVWSTRASLPIPAYVPSVAVVNGIIYVIGGLNGTTELNNVQAYDPVANSWSQKATMPTARNAAAAFVIDGTIYVAGGALSGTVSFDYTNVVEAYNPVSNSWSTKSPLGAAVGLPNGASANGVGYVMGGWDTSGASVTTVSAFTPSANLSADTWATRQSIPTARSQTASGVVNGILYVVGGVNGTNTVESYDPVANQWTAQASTPTARDDSFAAEVDGILYVIGGNGTNTVEAYNPVTNTWSTKTSMPTTINEGSGTALNGLIYALSGGGGANLVYAFDPQGAGGAGSWTAKATAPTNMNGAVAAAINGLIYANASDGTLGIYNPVLDSWSTGAINTNTQLEAGGGVIHGKLYVAGGRNFACGGAPTVATVVAYDPVANSWSTKASIPGSSMSQTASGVINGTLYMAGGSVVICGSSGYTGATDAYTP